MTTEDLVRAARDQGFVALLKDGRYRLVPPDKEKRTVVFSAVVGDGNPRVLKNIIAELRRSGLLWPPPLRRRKEEEQEDQEQEEEIVPIVQAKTPSTMLEDLFRELKDARDYLLLATEARDKAQVEAEAAQRKKDQAQADVAKARAELEAAKKRFDSACGL